MYLPKGCRFSVSPVYPDGYVIRGEQGGLYSYRRKASLDYVAEDTWTEDTAANDKH